MRGIKLSIKSPLTNIGNGLDSLIYIFSVIRHSDLVKFVNEFF